MSSIAKWAAAAALLIQGLVASPAMAACATVNLEADFYINGGGDKVYTGAGWWNVAISDLKSGETGWVRCEIFFNANGDVLRTPQAFSKCIHSSRDVPKITAGKLTVDPSCRLSGYLTLRHGPSFAFRSFVQVSGGQVMPILQVFAAGPPPVERAAMATGVGISREYDAGGILIPGAERPMTFTAVRSFVPIPPAPSTQ